jgi:hypothetical protein
MAFASSCDRTGDPKIENKHRTKSRTLFIHSPHHDRRNLIVSTVNHSPKPTNDDAFYKKLFGQLTQDKKRDNDLSLIALGPIISGLILESHFEPDRLTEKALRRILGRIFDALFSPL